jgi:hypothetical protein
MNAPPPAVTHPVLLEVIGPDRSIPSSAELRYDPSDPYAVSVAFLDAREVVWRFGRELLMQGVCEPAGVGDVHVSPALDAQGHAVVLLELRSGGSQALVEVSARDALEFLAHTTRAVWPGTESDHLGADAAIAALLVRD